MVSFTRAEISAWLRAWLHGEFQPGLKYCCDYMFNFSPGAKRKFPWESLLRFENTIDTHARAPFSARADKMKWYDSDYIMKW